jgi:hypothetical protein
MGMEVEMTAWKAKLYDVIRKVDKLGSAEKEKVLPNIEDLHIFLEEMSDRVETLKTECPPDLSPVKIDIEEGTTDMRENIKTQWIISAKPHRYPYQAKITGEIQKH